MTRVILSQSSAKAPQQGLPEPGDVVGGKYRIERTLGMGGMGAVYEVTHCVTEKRFAIKWLLSHAADTEEAVKRFVREAQIAGRVRHRNVVEVYDIYQEPSGIFLVMELLEGESLDARVARQGRLGVREACEILLASMEGVAAAHAAGVIHRDLKPANIFLCRGHGTVAVVHPKVLDFGISRLATVPGNTDLTTTRSGTVIGTPHYMAPEQMRTGPIDARTDVYALGITLYEVLAGARPYDAASYPDLVIKIASGAAVPLDQLAPDLPAGLAAIVARAMSPQPEERFATVEAFMEALRPYLAAGEGIGAGLPLAAAAAVPDLAARRLAISPPLVAGGLAALLAAALAYLVLSGPSDEIAAPVTQLRPSTEQPVAPSAPERSSAAATDPAPQPDAVKTAPASQPDEAAPLARGAPPTAAGEPAVKAKPKVKPKAANVAAKPRQEPPRAPELNVGPLSPPDPEPAAKTVRRDRPIVRLDREGF